MKFKNEKNQKIWDVTYEWGESIVVALVLALFIRAFFIQAFRIPSGSMEPTLQIGDRLLVSKLNYGARLPFGKRLPGFSEPHRGDVVVFLYPGNPKKDFIKRLIAKGGETVEIENGDIFIDGKLITDPDIKNTYYYNRGQYGRKRISVKIPEGQYFVLGDNSGSSYDSRFWGLVPQENMIGKAILIYWPLTRMRFIH